MNNSPAIQSTNQIISYLKEKGIAHMNVDGNKISGNLLSVNGREHINFGSCSYLGLEYDQRMINGSKETIDKYGTQFSASRAYVSAGMYQVLEDKLCQLFNGHVLVTPTTTLGHISTIPILIGRNDCVIMDHQVHHSVQTAVKLVKADGTHVELVRHNRMDLLEKRIIELKDKFDNIWYMADGIYSMYGDKAPIHELEALMNKYSHFRLYVDDAHAMSCFGENGKGFVLGEIDLHPQMVVGTSLNKAFASGGGAFIFPTEEMYQRVRNCGGPMITSGPMQPSALGAAIAAADIHLSNEIKEMQTELRNNILYCHYLLEKAGLPNLAEKDSPIFFVGVGAPKPAYDLIDHLLKDGFLVNIGIFPAVPMKNTGLRFTITRLHTFDQIEALVESLVKHYHQVLLEHKTDISEVCKAFKIDVPTAYNNNSQMIRNAPSNDLLVERYETIMDVNKDEWNNLLGKNGSFDWTAINIIENSFQKNERPEQNYDFEYLIIRDGKGKAVLATFFSSGIMKDDMLLDKEISENLEKVRQKQPLYACSRFLATGSMITEGNHVFIDQDHESIEEAIALFYQIVEELRKKYNASQVILRDFEEGNQLMDSIMVDNGYFKVEMPENNLVDVSNWNLEESYQTQLSKRSKKHFRQFIQKYADSYQVTIKQNVSESELQHYFKLYQNVQAKNMNINTFELPFELFRTMNESQNWEFIELKLTEDFGHEEAVSVVFAYKGLEAYSPTMMGMDYNVDSNLNVYRQSVYQAIHAGKANGYETIRLGFSAAFEKKKLGAQAYPCIAYMQSADHFNMEAILAANSSAQAQLMKA